MEKNKIIREYLINKVITQLDDLQTWQENLAESVEVLKEEPKEHQLATHLCMKALAGEIRSVMNMVYEIHVLDQKEEIL